MKARAVSRVAVPSSRITNARIAAAISTGAIGCAPSAAKRDVADSMSVRWWMRSESGPRRL